MFFMNYLLFISLIISIIIMLLSFIISMKNKNNNEKMSPFECGFNPFFYSRIPFSINFFLISIIFIIFDIEIAFIFPLIFSFKLSNFFIWIITIILFLLILMLGLIYEWKMNMFNWI